MNPWLFLLPVITAITCFFAIRIAGKILFKQILPRKQNELALRIGDAVSAQFSFIQIQDRIASPDSTKAVMPVVETHIDDFLRNKLKEKMPMIGMLIGDKTIQSLKEVFLKEIEEMFPIVISRFTGNLGKEFDLKEIISKKVNSIPVASVAKAFSPLQRFYEYAGLIAGFLSGLIALGVFATLH